MPANDHTASNNIKAALKVINLWFNRADEAKARGINMYSPDVLKPIIDCWPSQVEKLQML